MEGTGVSPIVLKHHKPPAVVDTQLHEKSLKSTVAYSTSVFWPEGTSLRGGLDDTLGRDLSIHRIR
jgi:hypothetical protein